MRNNLLDRNDLGVDCDPILEENGHDLHLLWDGLRRQKREKGRCEGNAPICEHFPRDFCNEIFSMGMQLSSPSVTARSHSINGTYDGKAPTGTALASRLRFDTAGRLLQRAYEAAI
jgi:hypothetical protein